MRRMGPKRFTWNVSRQASCGVSSKVRKAPTPALCTRASSGTSATAPIAASIEPSSRRLSSKGSTEPAQPTTLASMGANSLETDVTAAITRQPRRHSSKVEARPRP